jgi:hypothetical protein
MKIIKFTNNKLKALQELVNYSHTVCNSGCVYPKMINSKKDCYDCEFTKSVESIDNKI